MKMKKLSEKAERIISEMKKAGWLEADYYPGICIVLVKGNNVRTVEKDGTLVHRLSVPQ